MNKVDIKPLSANQSYRGVKYKTKEYLIYEKTLFYILPKIGEIPEKIFLQLSVGYSSRSSDIDNCVKPFTDVLSKYYNFNDNRVYELNVKKEIVKKGEEYIKFKISEYFEEDREEELF